MKIDSFTFYFSSSVPTKELPIRISFCMPFVFVCVLIFSFYCKLYDNKFIEFEQIDKLICLLTKKEQTAKQ